MATARPVFAFRPAGLARRGAGVLVRVLERAARPAPVGSRTVLCRPVAGRTGWVECIEAGAAATAARTVGLEALAEFLRGRDWIALFPTERVTLLAPKVRARHRHLRQAVAYAIEEQLAADVERVHVALGRGAARGTTPAAAVDPQALRVFIAPYAATGVAPRCVVPDVLALPWRPQIWSVAPDGERVLVRTGAHAGCVVPLGTFAEHLAILCGGGRERPSAVAVLGADPAGRGAILAACAAQGVPAQAHDAPGGLLPWLARGYAPLHAINLLQGPFAPAVPALARWPARALLGAGLLFAGVHLGGAMAERRMLEAERDRQLAQAAMVLTATFPEQQRVVDARAQMQEALTRLDAATRQAERNFLRLLADAGSALRTGAGVSVQAIEYGEGRLSFDLQAPEVRTLEEARARLLALPGIEARVTAVEAGSAGAVAGRVVVERQP